MRTVEERDATRLGQPTADAGEKLFRLFLGVGLFETGDRNTHRVEGPPTCLIVPLLPEPSRPCRTTSTECLLGGHQPVLEFSECAQHCGGSGAASARFVDQPWWCLSKGRRGRWIAGDRSAERPTPSQATNLLELRCRCRRGQGTGRFGGVTPCRHGLEVARRVRTASESGSMPNVNAVTAGRSSPSSWYGIGSARATVTDVPVKRATSRGAAVARTSRQITDAHSRRLVAAARRRRACRRRAASGNTSSPPVTLPQLPTSTIAVRPDQRGAVDLDGRIGQGRRDIANARGHVGDAAEAWLDLRLASRIIAASNPTPAITANRSPFTVPTSMRRTWP